MTELTPILVDLNITEYPTIHAIFGSIQEQANSQLPEKQRVSFVVQVSRVEPQPKRNEEIPSTGGYLRRVSLPDAVKYLTEIANLEYTVLEHDRKIVIKERIQP